MTFSTTAARHIVPLLARVLLCLVFVPAGWGMVMEEHDFAGSDVTVLRELGVLETPKEDSSATKDANKARVVNELAIYLKQHNAPQPVEGAARHAAPGGQGDGGGGTGGIGRGAPLLAAARMRTRAERVVAVWLSKDGQSVPVGVGLPTIRLDAITVGGTQG